MLIILWVGILGWLSYVHFFCWKWLGLVIYLWLAADQWPHSYNDLAGALSHALIIQQVHLAPSCEGSCKLLQSSKRVSPRMQVVFKPLLMSRSPTLTHHIQSHLSASRLTSKSSPQKGQRCREGKNFSSFCTD